MTRNNKSALVTPVGMGKSTSEDLWIPCPIIKPMRKRKVTLHSLINKKKTSQSEQGKLEMPCEFEYQLAIRRLFDLFVFSIEIKANKTREGCGSPRLESSILMLRTHFR